MGERGERIGRWPFRPVRVSLVAWLAVSLSLSGWAGTERPPNVVLIVADDLGYGDLGCYGSELNPTPHIDALAASGLRFTDFHSAGAMCSPTRASILTGRYPQRFGKIFDSALSGTSQRHLGLPVEAVTIAEVLREKGYATGCFGKWHLGYEKPFLPPNQGFEVFFGLVSGDGDFHTRVDRSGNEDWWSGLDPLQEPGYTTDLLTRHACEFIEAHRDGPFFLYLPHLAIHFPWQGPGDPPHRKRGTSYHDDKWGIIPDPGNVAPHVRAMIESLDRSVGAVVEAVRAHAGLEKTLILFTSDNGGYRSYGKRFRNISSNGPFRGQKTGLEEGGHRVPLIISWEGKIRSGVCPDPVHSNDFFPTLASLAGGRKVETDGVDLTGFLLEGEAIPERRLFWRTRSQGAVREGRWKWLRTGRKTAVFDLGSDPGETRDLSGREPERVKRMSDAWEKWNERMNLSADRGTTVE